MERTKRLQELFWTRDFGWMAPLRTVTCIIFILFIQVLLHLADKLETFTSSTDPWKPVRCTKSLEELAIFYRPENQCQQGRVVAEEKLLCAVSCNEDSGPRFYLSCSVGSTAQYVHFQVDTGCTRSSISVNMVKALGLRRKVNTNERMRFMAMGNVVHRTLGTLQVPLTTPSGIQILTKMDVLDAPYGILLGMDVLEILNCSIITDLSNPKLLIRERSACCPTSTYGAATTVPATLNGRKTPVLLDTGSCRTFVPPRLNFTPVSLSKTVKRKGAAPGILRMKHKTDLSIVVSGCAGRVSALVLPHIIPVIGTDFLKNKKIDIICGKTYISEL